MQTSLKNKTRLGLLAALFAIAGSLALDVSAAAAQSRPYFIEFRSRNAVNYGHAFVLFGRIGTKGKIAGFHPTGDKPDCENCSVFNWTIGHVIPVPAETGPSDGDDEPEIYLNARYRVMLTSGEYRKVAAYIKKKQADPGNWHAILNNCTHFIGDIAEYMGLEAPTPVGLLATRLYINRMAELNGGKPSKMKGLPEGLVRNAPDTLGKNKS